MDEIHDATDETRLQAVDGTECWLKKGKERRHGQSTATEQHRKRNGGRGNAAESESDSVDMERRNEHEWSEGPHDGRRRQQKRGRRAGGRGSTRRQGGLGA